MTVANGLAPVPPMGWNSYDCYGGEVTEDEVIANAEYLARHLKEHGWRYVVVDIGWHVRARDVSFDETGRSCAGDETEIDGYGRLLPAPDRFPSAANGAGFGPLAERVHALGLLLGIHVMPGIPEPAVTKRLPVKNSGTHAGAIVLDDAYNKLAPGFLRRLDMSAPGAQAYYDSLLEQYAEWGVDFIKADGIGFPYQPDAAEALHAARDRCGRDIVLSLSACHHDYTHYRRHKKNHWEMYRITPDFWDRWDHLERAFDVLPFWRGDSGPGHWADIDMLPLGRIGIRQHPLNSPDRMTRFTRHEQRTLVTLACIAQSPLMFGGDLPSCDEWTLSLLTNDEALDVDRRGRRPREAYRDCSQSAVVRLCDMGEDEHALGIFSFDGGREREITVPFGEIHLPETLHVRDLWERRDLGVVEGSFTVRIPPHGSGFYRVRAG